MTARPAAVRCAIYTRKSSEEGLDQAFNSLHAQREACEAFILSQAGEGWKALPAVYDDGGFSGGTLERPALQRLLADITAGRVDTVVVYKIDRLTRSLTDFAKIVERFDAVGASFVSVTQAFNTTTSMGRLTLNVLLSFAQFEREVTGERIRDKIAASKAKGMWMGGNLPLGYDRPTDPMTRALVVNEAEAASVRLIFNRYLELGSVRHLELWLEEEAIRSKAYVSARGNAIGGCAFSRGALFYLLKNRIYLGEIVHKTVTYPGRHAAIVDAETFEAAQGLLAANGVVHRERPTRTAMAPLKGILFDADGNSMSPTFAKGRSGGVYRYYVSAPLLQGRMIADRDIIRRVPAEALEDLILDRLARIARPPSGELTLARAKAVLRRIEIHPSAIHLILDRIALHGGAVDGNADLDRVRRRLGAGERMAALRSDDASVTIVLPVRMKLRGGKTWLVTPDGRDAVVKAKVDRTLVKGLHSAHAFVADFALHGDGRNAKAPNTAYDRRLCRLAFLAPDIQRAILEGRQPASLKLEQLVHQGFPLAWVDQRAALGF